MYEVPCGLACILQGFLNHGTRSFPPINRTDYTPLFPEGCTMQELWGQPILKTDQDICQLDSGWARVG